jgi:hypothetical protein
MISGSNGHAGFKVVPVGNVKSDLRQFHEELMQHGKGIAFLMALRQVNERLRDDPRGFGETL